MVAFSEVTSDYIFYRDGYSTNCDEFKSEMGVHHFPFLLPAGASVASFSRCWGIVGSLIPAVRVGDIPLLLLADDTRGGFFGAGMFGAVGRV